MLITQRVDPADCVLEEIRLASSPYLFVLW